MANNCYNMDQIERIVALDRNLEYQLKSRLFRSGVLQRHQANYAPYNPYIYKAPQAPVLPQQGPQGQYSQPATLQTLHPQQAQHSQPGTLQAVQDLRAQHARRAFYDPVRDNTRDSLFLFIISINIPLFVRGMVTNFINFFSTIIPFFSIIVALLTIILFNFPIILEIKTFLIEHFGIYLTYLF